MSDMATAKLNSKFSVISDELFGKRDTRFLKNGKRFTATKILSAGFLLTRAAVLGNGCSTSYSDFTEELGFARSTIARNVAELTDNGTVKRIGQSKYEADNSIDLKHGVPVYHFLCTETFNGKRLSNNDVLYLSFLIRHYTNQNREQKYFVGGEKRVAKTLKTAISTGCNVVNRLVKAGAIHRFTLHGDKLTPGAGFNNDYKTVYIVDDKILKRVRAIRKAQRKQKTNENAVKEIFATSSKLNTDTVSAKITENWQNPQIPAEKRAEIIASKFKNDFEFIRLKREYKDLNTNYINLLHSNRGQDTPSTLDTERQLNRILSDVLNYLLSHNVQRTYIPDDWRTFIISIIRN